jgi:hypothetical protein
LRSTRKPATWANISPNFIGIKGNLEAEPETLSVRKNAREFQCLSLYHELGF